MFPMENISAIVGSNLAALRKAKGMTQQELALEVHYSDKSISKWELGYSTPSVDVLMDFAAYFGVSLEYLVTEHGEGEAKELLDANAAKDPITANKFSVLGLTVMVVVLIDLSIFFSELFFRKTPADYNVYSILPWMVPVSCLIAAFQVRAFFHNRVAVTVLMSAFVWTLLLCFCLQFAVFSATTEGIWVILFVGIPIQVILILLANWKKTTKKSKEPSK